MKIGRNEICWCGSGKKFKKCHLGRSEAVRPSISEGMSALKNSERGRGCMCPPSMAADCSGPPINSHSIAKGLGLMFLAERGHVLVPKSDFSTLSKSNGTIQVGKIGVNKASVFPGFCQMHDKQIFAPIEDRFFSAEPRQCALLSYRAIARELHTKFAGTDVNEFLKGADKGQSFLHQMMLQSNLAAYGLGLSLATDDLSQAIEIHHKAVIDSEFSHFESLAFEFSDKFPILGSTGHMPSEDWSGRVVQDLADPKLKADWLTAVVFHSGGRAWVVLTWLKSSTKMRGFVDSLQENFADREADALVKYFFSISENIAIRPSWWEALDHAPKSALKARIMDGIPVNPGENVMAPKLGEPEVLSMPVLSVVRIGSDQS